MRAQHLSDEAVAACADGVLGGHAHDRAMRHVAECAECAHAVRVQREAVWALRAAPPPCLPSGLASRLRAVPQTTPIEAPPTVIAEDGTAMFATFASAAPMAALVPDVTEHAHRHVSLHRAKPYVASAAVVVLAGALVAGSVTHDAAGARTGHRLPAHDPSTVSRPLPYQDAGTRSGAVPDVATVHSFGVQPQ